MAEYIIKEETLTAIADTMRMLTGSTEKMTPDAMLSTGTATNEEVDLQRDLIAQIKTALAGKTAVEDAQLPTMVNEATAGDLAEGKQLIGSNKEIVTGTMVVSTIYISETEPDISLGEDGDIYIKRSVTA